MRKTKELEIKKDITIVDKANAVDEIVNYCFIDNDFTPYYYSMGTMVAIAKYFVDGVEFDEDDFVLELITNDEELNKVVFDFLNVASNDDISDDELSYHEVLSEVVGFVEEKIEFRKQRLIHGSDTIDLIGELLENIVPAISGLANLNLETLSPDVIDFGTRFIKKIADKEITEETMKNTMKSVIGEIKYDESKNDTTLEDDMK